VQGAGDVRWWQQDAEVILLGGVQTSGVVALALPELVPLALKGFGVEGLRKLATCRRVVLLGVSIQNVILT
jgi:hypothetical protein